MCPAQDSTNGKIHQLKTGRTKLVVTARDKCKKRLDWCQLSTQKPAQTYSRGFYIS